MSDLIVKGAGEIKDGLYNIKDGKLFKYKANGGTVRTYQIVSADRPTGRWHIEPGIGCFCSKCSFDIGNDLDFMEYVHYCPNCGADMRGGPTLTPEEFAEKMAGIAENGDEERKHVAADSIMCELLKSLGFGEGVGIFEDMDKWYS